MHVISHDNGKNTRIFYNPLREFRSNPLDKWARFQVGHYKHFCLSEKQKKKPHVTLNQSLQPAAWPGIFPFFLSVKNRKMEHNRVRWCKRSAFSESPNGQGENGILKCLTHSSMTSPSPTILGPVSSGGFFRASSAASASANCRLSFSRGLTEMGNDLMQTQTQIWTSMRAYNQLNPTYRARALCIKKNNPQNLLFCNLILLLIKLWRKG